MNSSAQRIKFYFKNNLIQIIVLFLVINHVTAFSLPACPYHLQTHFCSWHKWTGHFIFTERCLIFQIVENAFQCWGTVNWRNVIFCIIKLKIKSMHSILSTAANLHSKTKEVLARIYGAYLPSSVSIYCPQIASWQSSCGGRTGDLGHFAIIYVKITFADNRCSFVLPMLVCM